MPLRTMIAAALTAATLATTLTTGTPAHANPELSHVDNTGTAITVHNPSTNIVTYRVQIHDAAITFDLDSGAMRTFTTVPAIEPVHWAVWSGAMLIDSGTMNPAAFGDTLPDEAVAAELAPAPVTVVDDTDWIREGAECFEDDPSCWDCETMGNGICGPDTERPAELIPPLVVVNPTPAPAVTTPDTNTVPAWSPFTIVAGQHRAV